MSGGAKASFQRVSDALGPFKEWALVALAALVVVAFVMFSPGMAGAGGANAILVLAAIVAIAAVVAFRHVRERDVKEWSTLFLTVAVVYAILASFSLRQGDLAEQYLVEIGFTVAIFAIFALGLSVEMGYAGLLNFGHVAFMLIGGYTVALWTTQWGTDLAPSLEGAGLGAISVTLLACAIIGLVVYVPLLLLVGRIPMAPRTRMLAAAAPAVATAVWFAAVVLPLDGRGAMAMVAMLGLVMGVVFAAVAGLLLGMASLRLREDYLAIVTLGSAEILRVWATNAREFTNGSLGVLLSTGRHHMPIASWARENEWFRHWARSMEIRDYTLLANAIVALIVLALAFLALETLARSPWGRVLRAIREDEEVPAALGKNVLRYKLQALMLGSAIAAIAGILFVWKKTNVYPTDFFPIVTFYAVAILVLGGIGNHKGAILGAVIIWGIFEFARGMNTLYRVECQADTVSWWGSIFCDFAGPKQQLLVGLVLILVIMFRPQGAVGNKEELAHAK